MGSSAMTHSAMQPHSIFGCATIYPYSRLTTLDVGMIREVTLIYIIPLSYSDGVATPWVNGCRVSWQKNPQNRDVMVV